MFRFVLGYVVMMHLLVFFTLYYTAHRVHCDPTVDHFAGSVVSSGNSAAASSSATGIVGLP